MKKIVKRVSLTFCILILVSGLGLGLFLSLTFLSYNKALSLDESKLTSSSLAIEIYDNENRPIKEENLFNGNYVNSQQIPQHVKDAFISIEDKDFYNHHGINYKRIAKAFLNNLKSMNLKEGASTISQQLIKNTHLTSEKTFKRKNYTA